MTYAESDLRSQLATATRAPGAAVSPQYFVFPTMEPTEVTDKGSQTWFVRSQSLIVAFTQVRAGDTLVRNGQPDEYMVLAYQPDADVTATANGQTARMDGPGVIVMPPGDGSVTFATTGAVARVFSAQAEDLAAMCANADFYADPDPNVADWKPWPDPPAGFKIRVYRLADIPNDPQRFGRLLRCTTLMVNFFEIDPAPRDPAKLSPHHHDDFEQISLTFLGDYVHHIRTPWTVAMDQWRDDDHHYTPSPAVTVIPPPTVHTSQGVHHMPHLLIDLFGPPRMDFSQRPGWVINHDEYPMPDA